MDEKQKKTLLIIGIVLVLLIIGTVILLVLNRGRDPEPTPPVTPNGNNIPLTNENVTLTYWGLWEPPSVMQPIIEQFEDIYPNIKIEYSQQSFTQYESILYTRLQQAAGTGEPTPDIFRIHNTWTPKYYKYLYPMPSEVMTVQEYSEIFYPTSLTDFSAKDGNIYAIPWSIDGLMVFYNKQLLGELDVEKPPEDWDSFFELAQRLTKKDETGRIIQSGVAMGTSRNIRHSAEILSYLLVLEGIDVIDASRTRVTLNTPRAQRVFEVYTNFARGDTAVWSSTLRTDLEMFFAGNLAMMIAPSWRAFDIIEAAPNIEFDTATLPQLKENEENVFYATYWGDAVSRSTLHPLEAWAFVRFLAEKEQQMQLYSNASKIRAFGEPYSLIELANEMRGKPYVSAIAEMAPYMKSWNMGDEATVNMAIDDAITNIVENGKDISSSLKTAEQIINDRIQITNN